MVKNKHKEYTVGQADNQQNMMPLLKKTHKKRWIAIILVVAIFIAGALSAWLFIFNKTSQPESDPNAIITNIEQVMDDAKTLANNGKFDEAVALYDKTANDITDPVQKSGLISSKAVLYMNNEQYDKALTVAKEAEAINQNENVTYLIAQIYEKMGDNQNAAEYYKKTIPIVDKSRPMADEDIAYYQSKVDALSGVQN